MMQMHHFLFEGSDSGETKRPSGHIHGTSRGKS